MKRIASKGALATLYPTPIFPGQILHVNLPGIRFYPLNLGEPQ